MKNLKKMPVILLVVLMGVFFASCSKKVSPLASPEATPKQQEKSDQPIAWKQSLFPQLAVGDPINFLNSTTIVLEGSFFNETFFLEDGIIYKMDSIKSLQKTVPTETLGVLTSFKKNQANIEEMNISFSSNDVSYLFNFRRTNDNSFILNGNAVILYKGNEYKVVAKTDGVCRLLVRFVSKKDVETINEQAEGQEAIGTKVIKK